MEYILKEFNNVLSVSRIANIHYFEFTNKYKTKSDRHQFRELIYIDNGELYIDGESYKGILPKNSLIIHRSDELHSLCSTERGAPSVIIIGFECDCRLLDRFSCEPSALSPQLQRVLTDVVKEGRSVFLPPYDEPYILDMQKRSDYPFGADQMIRLKLETFLIQLIRASENKNHGMNIEGTESISEITKYIKENCCRKITLDELCFLFGTNKTTLCRNFKETNGCTLNEYLNGCRISRAKELMRSGMSIAEISDATGFSSVHYFYHVFKKYERKSPKEYMNTIKSKLGI